MGWIKPQDQHDVDLVEDVPAMVRGLELDDF